MRKPDRRTRRTRELLQRALVELLGERRYETITIRDIAERADVARATFYLHYTDKDALFLGCHEAIVGAFHLGPHHPLSREELLAPDAPPGLAAAYAHLGDVRVPLRRFFRGKDGPLMLGRIRDGSARAIEANLRAAFADAAPTVPLGVLARYLAGAQIALMHWWLEQPQPQSAETMAQALHRLQRAALHEAFPVQDDARVSHPPERAPAPADHHDHAPHSVQPEHDEGLRQPHADRGADTRRSLPPAVR
jgi:AcrR family transcriptional regulator